MLINYYYKLFFKHLILLLILIIYSNTSLSAKYEPWSLPKGHSQSWFNEGDEVHEHIYGEKDEGIKILESRQRPWFPMVTISKIQSPKQTLLIINIATLYTKAQNKTSKVNIILDGKAWNHHKDLEMDMKPVKMKNWRKINKYADSDTANYVSYQIMYNSKSDINKLKKSRSMQVKINNLEMLIDLQQFDLDRLKWYVLK